MKVVVHDSARELRDEMHNGVHYQLTGSGPRTIVLIHGFSDNLATWHRIVPALAIQHRVIAIDLPSHGRTTRRWRHPLLDACVEVVDEVLTECGVVGPITLMGNSMGGAVAALFAHQNPERVEAVVLIGTPGVRAIPRAWRVAASRPAGVALRGVTKPLPLAPLLSIFAWGYTHAAVPRAASIDPATLLSYRASYPDRERLFELHAIARAMMRDLTRVRLARVLAELPMPVLQLWGQYDPLVPARHAPKNRADVAVLKGCGHCPQLDAPEQLLHEVLPFLATAYGEETTPAEESAAAAAG